VSDAVSGPSPRGPSASSTAKARDPEGAHEAPAAEEPDAVARAIRELKEGTGSEESFRVLYESYYAPVRGFFARRVSSTDECLDLTQETFLRVYKGLRAYRGDAPFGAWLFRIAWNVLHSHRAKKARRPEPIFLEETDLERTMTTDKAGHQPVAAGAFSSVLRDERRGLLRAAVAKLPEQRRRCIILWAYRELTYEQIAVVMRLSLGTVKAHLAQARRQLETIAGETGSDSGGGS
jgi:RNA polymerase sigma-70 factor (ECF subfamily)